MTLEELAVEMRAGFTQINERLDGLESKVDGLESKVDELSDTMDDRFAHLLAALIKAGLANPIIRDGD